MKNLNYKSNILNNDIKLCLTLLLVFCTKTNFWLSELFLSFGIPYLPFQKLIFFVLPFIFIISSALKSNNLKFHYFYLFLFVFSYFFIHEYFFVSNLTFNNSYLDFIGLWCWIYFSAFAFINTGLKYFKFILSRSITLILIINVIIYLDIINVVNVANISIGTLNLEGRLTSDFNLNSVCDLNIFACFCFLWLKKENYKYSNLPVYIFIIPLSFLVFIQSSRGSLLLLLLFVFYYYTYYSKIYNVNFFTKLILASIFLIFLVFNFSFIFTSISDISVFNRFESFVLYTDLNADYIDGRYLQIIASFNNFIDNPYFGVGYGNAAAGIIDDIVRSNFQYTQILATGGIVFALFYSYLIFKLFAYNIKSLISDKIISSIFYFILFLFVFRRPDFWVSIMIFIVYYRTYYNNNEFKSN